MADRILLVGWGATIPGREERARGVQRWTWRAGDRRYVYAVLVLLMLEPWMILPRAFTRRH